MSRRAQEWIFMTVILDIARFLARYFSLEETARDFDQAVDPKAA
jgi:hypothetical protein